MEEETIAMPFLCAAAVPHRNRMRFHFAWSQQQQKMLYAANDLMVALGAL